MVWHVVEELRALQEWGHGQDLDVISPSHRAPASPSNFAGSALSMPLLMANAVATGLEIHKVKRLPCVVRLAWVLYLVKSTSLLVAVHGTLPLTGNHEK